MIPIILEVFYLVHQKEWLISGQRDPTKEWHVDKLQNMHMHIFIIKLLSLSNHSRPEKKKKKCINIKPASFLALRALIV